MVVARRISLWIHDLALPGFVVCGASLEELRWLIRVFYLGLCVGALRDAIMITILRGVIRVRYFLLQVLAAITNKT
jgi:hypothetical protein